MINLNAICSTLAALPALLSLFGLLCTSGPAPRALPAGCEHGVYLVICSPSTATVVAAGPRLHREQ